MVVDETVEEGISLGEIPQAAHSSEANSGEQRHTGMDRSKLSHIIEMLEKVNKVKRLLAR